MTFQWGYLDSEGLESFHMNLVFNKKMKSKILVINST